MNLPAALIFSHCLCLSFNDMLVTDLVLKGKKDKKDKTSDDWQSENRFHTVDVKKKGGGN